MFLHLEKLGLFLRRAASPFFLFLLYMSSPACATDVLDLSTGLKTLLLMNDRPSGVIGVAVVFDPSNAESRADAESIKAHLDGGAGVPSGLKVAAQLVSLSELTSASGYKVLLLSQLIAPDKFDGIARIAAEGGMLTLSTDLACVKANQCVFGIVSKPRVEIYYSQTAAGRSHVGFASAFLMLVKRI